MYRNGLIFVDTQRRDNRGSLNFQVGKSKLPYILQNFQFVIIGAGQIIKSHQQNCFILRESLPRDNRGSANCQVTHQNCLIFAKVSARDNRGSSNF